MISDAEVAEISYTAFSGRHRVTARLIVRRVKDANYPDVWGSLPARSAWGRPGVAVRYHLFFTNSDLPTVDADVIHRKHAIMETVFADLIDGPLAHIPSGRFGANSAWVLCAAIAHNLLRAAGALAGGRHAVARGATLRRHLVNVPARVAKPARNQYFTCPPTGQAGRMENALAQRYRTRTTTSGLTHEPGRTRPRPRNHVDELTPRPAE